MLARHARCASKPTFPIPIDDSQSRRSVYFANVASSHAQVFAQAAGRRTDDFVRVGDLRQLEVELVDELCVEFGPLVFGDVVAGADVAEEFARRREARRADRVKPAVFAFGVQKTRLSMERRARFESR